MGSSWLRFPFRPTPRGAKLLTNAFDGWDLEFRLFVIFFAGKLSLNWVKSLHYPHFEISDIEKIFGEKYNNLMKHLIITSKKDVIYFKRKTGDNMQLSDVKRMLVKNLHILKTQNLLKVRSFLKMNGEYSLIV